MSVYGIVVLGVGQAGSIRIRNLTAMKQHRDVCWDLKGFVSRYKSFTLNNLTIE